MRINEDVFYKRNLGIWIEEGAGGAWEEPEDCWEGEKFLEGPHFLSSLCCIRWGSISRIEIFGGIAGL